MVTVSVHRDDLELGTLEVLAKTRRVIPVYVDASNSVEMLVAAPSSEFSCNDCVFVATDQCDATLCAQVIWVAELNYLTKRLTK